MLFLLCVFLSTLQPVLILTQQEERGNVGLKFLVGIVLFSPGCDWPGLHRDSPTPRLCAVNELTCEDALREHGSQRLHSSDLQENSPERRCLSSSKEKVSHQEFCILE